MPEARVHQIRVHYLEHKGDPSGRKPKVLFIHGSGGNAGIWRNIMERIQGYDSLALSLPGHGESEGEGMRSIPAYRDFLRDFLDALGLGSAVLGGHSLGGGIVLDFALRYPARTSALLLMGTGARLRVLPAALERLRQMAEGAIPPQFEPWGFAEKAAPEVLAGGEREWARTSPRVRYGDMLACDQFDILGEVAKIHVPALILCGREDRLTPVKYSEFLRQKISGAQLEILEGAGHMAMLETPESMAAAIMRFLDSL